VKVTPLLARNLLIVCVAILLAVGIVEIYSASAIKSAWSFHDDTVRLRKHLLDITIGLAAMLVMIILPPRVLQRMRTPLIGVTLLMLFLVLVPGLGSKSGTGARRWFSIFGQSFQPSEVAKYALLLFVASWAAERKDGFKRFHPDFTVPMGMIAATVLLVVIEPSISAAAFIAIVNCVLLAVSGARFRHFLPVGGGLAAVAVILIGAVIVFGGNEKGGKFSYARDRINIFLNKFRPENERTDVGGKEWQSEQATIALTEGGWFGTGLGKGRQQLFYLPESDSDFIFAIIAQETGFVGASIVILLFILFLYSAMKIAFAAPDMFSGLLTAGIGGALGLQAFIHIGVVTGSLFLTGAPLPFITRGGTAMIFSLAAVGFMIGTANRSIAAAYVPKKTVKRHRPRAKATTVRTRKPVVVKDFANNVLTKK
jgi:cell division protein FtsW